MQRHIENIILKHTPFRAEDDTKIIYRVNGYVYIFFVAENRIILKTVMPEEVDGEFKELISLRKQGKFHKASVKGLGETKKNRTKYRYNQTKKGTSDVSQ